MFEKIAAWNRAGAERLAAACPSVLVLIGALTGVLPFAWDPDIAPVRAAAIALCLVAAAFLVWPWRVALKMALWALAAFLWTAYRAAPRGDDYAARIGAGDVAAELRGVCVETQPPERRFPWLKYPTYVLVRVEAYRALPEKTWVAVSGKTLLRLARDVPFDFAYGQKIEASGAFMTPSEARFSGAFDQRRYFLARGVRRWFYARSVRAIAAPASPIDRVAAAAFAVRDRMIDDLCSGLKDDRSRAFLAGIVFGAAGGMDKETRNLFTLSGTGHILAISGFNVVIIGMLLGWVFRWVPYRSRYAVVGVVLTLYVFMVGYPPSAVRALIMVLLYCVFKATMDRGNSWNAIAFAALSIMAINPFAVLDVGFQFSFTVTALLIATYDRFRQWRWAADEKARWLPAGYRLPWAEKAVIAMVFSALGCGIASLASLGLTARYQHLYVPLSTLINFLVLPAMLPLSIVAGLKLAFAAVLGQGIANALNPFIQGICAFVFSVNAFGAECGGPSPAPSPSVLSLLLFYGALTVFCLARKARTSLIAAAAVTAIAVFWAYRPDFAAPRVMALSDGGGHPPAIVVNPGAGLDIDLINCPTFCWTVLETLTREGADGVALLACGGARTEYCGGMPTLLEKFPVALALLPNAATRVPSRDAAERACRGRGVTLASYDLSGPAETALDERDPNTQTRAAVAPRRVFDNRTFQARADGSAFAYTRQTPVGFFAIDAARGVSGQWRVTVRRDDGPERTATLSSAGETLILP